MAEFHFLRPAWLLMLLALPFLYVTIRHLRSGDSGWARLIPKQLLTPILSGRGTARERIKSPVIPAMVAMAILSIALAGPAWREAPTPLKQPGDSLVIVLDLSLSMLATDVEPDRLTLAKRKIRDILGVREGSLNGLVVYSADSHVVSPLTEDRRTIEGMLEVLDPVIMPAPGNRADLAIDQARSLLEQGAPGKGRILLISDDVPARYFDAIRDSLRDTELSLSTLTVGTPEGGPIPLAKRGFIRDNGEVVITRADPEGMAFLASKNHGTSHTLTLDNKDIDALNVAPDAESDWQDPEQERTIKRWQDDGYWFLWALLPLLLLGWRRGAFAVIAVSLIPLAAPRPAQAMDWDSLWQREDQRAPDLIKNDPENAAKTLTTPSWRGSAQFRANQFEQAAETFAEVPGAAADFNRGNALAKAGKLKEALDAYDEALKQNPKMEDATFNRALVEKLLEKQKQQQKNSGKNQSKDQKNQSDKNNQQKQNQQQKKNNQGQQQNQNQQNNSQSDQNGQQQQDKQSSPSDESQQGKKDQADNAQDKQQNPEKGSEQDTPKQPSQAPADISEQPLSQGQEQWLRRVPDNPGGLLRRKFLQQYQERQTPSDEGDTPW